jgi:two-component system nitrogen regulation response regulator NtrX
MVIMIPDTRITGDDIALFLSPGRQLRPAAGSSIYNQLPFKDARKQFEHDYLKSRLEENKGNVSQTAEKIGMERSHLHKKVKALHIVLEE